MTRPPLRKLIGYLALVTLIGGYALVVGLTLARIGRLPLYIEAPLYLIAGVAWIVPAGPLLTWTQTGRWRRKPAD